MVKAIWIAIGLACLPGLNTGAAEIDAFLETHCIECHDDLTAEGGLDLYSLSSGEMGESIHQWTSIFDRVEKGEMPPAKVKTRPSAQEISEFLQSLDAPLATADRALREVVQRRLNRVEYENTVRDLLGVEIDLQELLPEDQVSHGFDNIGSALALSPELMGRYLAAARIALDAAMVEGDRPKMETFTVDSIHEVESYLEKGQYALVDGRVVQYLTPKGQYSKISTRARRGSQPGRYRFRFTAATHRSETPLVFRVVASDFKPGTPTFENLGYYEVGAEPTEFVIEAELGAKHAIQFFALGLRTWGKEPAKNPEFPGIGFGPVEVTGPLTDEWPPKSHHALTGDPEEVLRRFLPRAFRRPVNEGELIRYLDLAKERSLPVALAAVMCSPKFLYLQEAGPDLDQYELASRLSYFLWSTMPDEALLTADLTRPEVLRSQLDRMLDHPKSETFVENFVGQWLHLRKIDETTPDEKLYPEFDELLQVSMIQESEGFFREILEQNLPVKNFLDSDFSMLNARLAQFYGVPNVKGFGLQRVSLPEDSIRGGVLTQAAVLKVTANGTNTSPVLRGVWVLENILGSPTPPPPPNIAGIEPDIREATTIREQLALHREATSCQSCHAAIDPPGFALEAFDPVGRYRENYARWFVSNAEKGWGRLGKGASVDASGVLKSGETFAGIAEFKTLLLEREEDFVRCLTEKLMTYALGRELGYSDRPAIDAIAETNIGLRTLVREVVESELFQRL